MSTLRPFRPAHTPGPPRVVPRRPVSTGAEPASAPSDPVLAAEAEAAAIIVAAESERDRMVAEGYAHGLARADEAIAAERARLAAAIDSLAAARGEVAGDVAQSAAHLAVEIALSLVEDAVAASPQSICPIIERALAASPAGPTRVRVHPALGEVYPGGGDVEVIIDHSLEPGDVVVETAAGEVDHRLRVTQDLLHDAIRAARPSSA